MSDKFSVDDILSQYSSKSKGGSKDEFDLESFIAKKTVRKVEEKPAPRLDAFELESLEEQRAKEAEQAAKEAQAAEPNKVGQRAQENTVQVRIVEESTLPDETRRAQQNTVQVRIVEEIKLDEEIKPAEEAPKEQVKPEEIDVEPIIEEVQPAIEDVQPESPKEDLGDIKFDNVKVKDKPATKKINTSVIERLVQRKKANSDISATGAIPPVNRASVKDIDMGLEGKIIPKTEQIEIAPDATDEEKMAVLEKRREKKVKNFVLDAAIDEEEKTEAKEQPREKAVLPIEEFTSFDQASHVMSDIAQLKSNIVIRLCVLVFTSLFAVYLTLANDLGLPIITVFSRDYSPEAYVFTLTILGIISAFVSYTVIFSGLKKLLKLSADCDSIAAIGITATVLSGIINLFSAESIQAGNYHVYTAAAILGLLFNALGKLSIVNRTERNFRFVAGEFEKHAFTKVEDEDVAYKFTKGTLDDFPELATTRKTEFVEDFLANSYSSDISDDYSKKAAPIIAAVGIVAAIVALFTNGGVSGAEKIMTSLAALCGVISMSASVAIMFIVNIPLARASKKFLQSSAVMLGYSAVDEYADTNSVLIDAEQLFPEGMVDLVNLKAMSSTLIEDCILYAASLTCQAGGVMKPTFYKMLRGKTEMLYPVESYIYEDGLGLSGWIENKRVLLGSRELMENHSIEGLPTLAKEAEYSKGNIPVYLSISGVVSAIFFIRASANVTVSTWLQELTDRGITVVVRSADAFISAKFISEMFEVSQEKIRLLPFRFYKEYENERAYTPKVSSPMMCSGHFPSMAMLICGTKNIQVLSILGMTIQMTFSILGAIIGLVMLVMGTFSQLTASVVICFNLVCLLVTMLVQQCKKV